MDGGERLVHALEYERTGLSNKCKSCCRISHFAHLEINRSWQVIAVDVIALLSPLTEIFGSLHAAHDRHTRIKRENDTK